MIEKWPEEFLRCRSTNHPWHPSRATYNRNYGVYTVVERCPRCKAERKYHLGRYGTREGSVSISYPDGYLVKGGGGRIDQTGRDQIRLAMLQGALTIVEDDDAPLPPSVRSLHELGGAA